MRTAMQNFVSRSVLLSVLALAAVGCEGGSPDEDAVASEAATALLRKPVIPPELAVPEGNALAFSLYARGVQIYVCKAAADAGFVWTFQEPDADLYGLLGLLGIKAGHHYAGPTWEARDGSTVVGARVAGVTPDTTAIPWLLLRATSNTGTGRMGKVTFIQRLFTVGGLAPTSGCSAEAAGELAEVDYRAVYAFYRQ